MNIDHKYTKEYNNNILNQKILQLNNISTDFSKTNKLNNNYLNQKVRQLNTNFNNNNYIYDKKIFKNTKLYKVVKPTKIKKRNYSNQLIHNNLISSSLTEGNINNNSKKFLSIFHSNTLKPNNVNIKIQKNKFINIKNNINNNELFHNSNSFKLLKKSKSNIGNIGHIKHPKHNNLFINVKDKKKTINTNNIFSTIGQKKNIIIKNNSDFNKNDNQIINSNINISNNKISESIPKRSGEIREKIKTLKKEIENYKKEINQKDDIIKQQNLKINKLNNDYENKQNILKKTQKEFDNLKQEYNIMKNNYLLLKDKLNEYEKNIKIMKKKEVKLMQVLYLIKEKGIDINSILIEVNQVTFHEYNNNDNNENNIENKDNNNNNLIINSLRDNNNNENGLTDLTVYFPDKVKMNNIMETKWGQNIPRLNFGYVPEYSSDSESQHNNNIYNNNTFIEEENLYFAKFNKFQNSA